MDVRRSTRVRAFGAGERDHVPAMTAMQAFASAAEHRSFSRAAEALGVTHGAIIHHVNALERKLGVQLVERGPRSLGLTPRGVELYQRMVEPLRQLETVFKSRTPAHRHLVITTVPSFATGWLMPRMGALLAALPGAELVIKSDLTVVDLRDGAADIAIRLGEGPWDGLTAVPLAGDEVFPVASASYPLLRSVRKPADLAHVTVIDNPLMPWTRWLQSTGSGDIRLHNRIEIADSYAAQLAAEGGAGIALARRVLANRALACGRLVRLLDASYVPPQRWWAVWRPSNVKRDAILTLVSTLQRMLHAEAV